MGAWGYGIRQDDYVLDIVGAFDDCLKKGGSLGDATSEVTSRFGASGGDDADPEGQAAGDRPELQGRYRHDLRGLILQQTENPEAKTVLEFLT